jgi:hypothetical protein
LDGGSYGSPKRDDRHDEAELPTIGHGLVHPDVKVAGRPSPEVSEPPLESPEPLDERPHQSRTHRDDRARENNARDGSAPEDSARDDRGGRGRRRPSGKSGLIAAAAAVTVLAGGGTALALTGSDEGDETVTVSPARVAPQLAADAMRGPTEAQTRRMLADRAARAARRDAAKRPVLAVRGTPPPEEKETEPPTAAPAGNPVPAGEAQRIAKALLPKYGFNPNTQFGCLVNLWNRESHWNVHAGSPGGPYGIPQANPGSKMASAGSDWLNSATTQINWGLGYIKNRYGGPCDAWSHAQSTGWY